MKFLNVIKWIAAHAAWLTMAFSPVALGAEAEKISKQKLAQYLQEFGLNKKTTVGEFWEKSKAYYPGYMYKEVEAFVQQNKNVQMPEIVLSSVQATDGTEIPSLQFTQNGKTNAVQFFSEKNKWAKFNSTALSTQDLEHPEEIFTRLQASDIRVKKEADLAQLKSESSRSLKLKNQSQQQKDLARFKGFPRMTPQLWKAMTPVQRASFFVNMRLMWRDAQKVLDSAMTVTNRSDRKNSSAEYFFNSFLSEANAEGTAGTAQLPDPAIRLSSMKKPAATEKVSAVKSGQTEVPAKKPAPRVFDANSCIVAGYVGGYDTVDNNRGKNRQGCSVEKAIDSYRARELLNDNGVSAIANANSQCSAAKGSNFIACNPLVYGYPSGKPACVNKSDSSFQTATHYQGACDAQSPLTSSKEPLFKDKDYSNIVPREKQIAMIEADQEKQKNELTKQFLNGVLNAKEDKNLFNAFQKGDWSKELDNELVRIQSSFEEEINGAIKTCEADTKNRNEANQKGACDQLHRRWLFTEKFLIPIRAKACAPGTKYIGSDKKLDDLSKIPLLCQCESDPTKNFPLGKDSGAQCSGAVAPAEAGGAPVVEKSCPLGTNLQQGGDENKCVCSNNKEIILASTTPPEKVKELCEGKSNLWKWALGGLGVLALLALFNRHKDKNPDPIKVSTPPMCGAGKQMVGTSCVCSTACAPGQDQNAISCACSSVPPLKTCVAPKVGVPPACNCPLTNGCTPGQQIYNQMTCQCDSVIQPITCPNGSKPTGNSLSNCPKCANGSLQPVGGCPVPHEGGSGKPPCPNGNCVGGVPTAK